MIKSTYLIVEASSLFLFSFFFLWDKLLCNTPVVFPTGPSSECAFSSAFGSDIHRRKRRVTALTSISPASE